MKIGIMGVTGLIGRRVEALAHERGHEVIGFSRDPRQAGQNARRFGTVSAPDVNGCDAILNLAGENVVGLWTPAKKRAIRESRVQGTRRIVEAMRLAANPPRVLVNASGVGIYQDTGDNVADEEAPFGKGFLAEVCWAWEAEALRARETGARVALLRTGIVLAREGGALAAMLPVFRLGLGGKIGNGQQWVPWIHIDDEAAIALAAVENEALTGPVNAVSPSPVRNEDFTQALAEAVGKPAFLKVPALALRLAGGFAAELLASQRILPVAAADAGVPFRFPSLPEALADLIESD